jgi:glycosyltransferase involved in cell wall biosynthesis
MATPLVQQPADGASASMAVKVLRLYHSGVVSAWRQRDRELRRLGADVTLVTAQQWDEGGAIVRFGADGDQFVVPVRTFGSRPNLFLFDPRPLWRLLARHRFDLIDIHEEPCSLATAEILILRALRARRVPFVLYSAQNIEKRYPPPFRWTEKFALRHCAGAYVCNSAAGENLRRKGLRAESRVLPLGVDVTRFTPVQREAPHERLCIGYVGRLADYKGVDVLLHAVSGDPAMSVEIVGTGPEEAALRDLATRLGLSDRARFRGFADHADLPQLYRTFDIVAVPTIPTPNLLEQFCRVAVEAMAAGVPVVASAIGALPEVVGAGGLLVAPSRPDELHAALRRFLDDPQLWRECRQAALDGTPQFAWGTVAGGQFDLYREAIQ